jgi:hypothetical protein
MLLFQAFVSGRGIAMEITPVTPVPRTTKVRISKAVVPKSGTVPDASPPTPVVTKSRKRKTLAAQPEQLSPDGLQQMIATAAYYLAEQRCFAPGCEVQDWLTAERQILGAVGHQ